jgi:hypothetical protein
MIFHSRETSSRENREREFIIGTFKNQYFLKFKNTAITRLYAPGGHYITCAESQSKY